MNEVNLLVSMSKYAGERFDLIQAGGGNSSVKFTDGTMAIKASGYLLSDIDYDRGYSLVNNGKVVEILSCPEIATAIDKKEREQVANRLLQETILTPGTRPSIETFLHALLSKFTLHTHPITVNAITCLPDWKSKLTDHFGEEIALVEYETPGIDLALRLKERFDEYVAIHSREPNIVFLQNHGLIVSSDSYEEIATLTDLITSKLETLLGISFERYRLTNRLSKIVNQVCEKNLIAYLTEDQVLIHLTYENRGLLTQTPYFPDGLVFLGYQPLVTDWNNAQSAVATYVEQYKEEPKVVVIKDQIYLIASNIKKAKEVEDVLKLHLLGIQLAPGMVRSLPLDELKYLGNWEAEKFRQKL